jgi:hypothetical protein
VKSEPSRSELCSKSIPIEKWRENAGISGVIVFNKMNDREATQKKIDFSLFLKHYSNISRLQFLFNFGKPRPLGLRLVDPTARRAGAESFGYAWTYYLTGQAGTKQVLIR